jgi:ketosteroid isomerase-like protein
MMKSSTKKPTQMKSKLFAIVATAALLPMLSSCGNETTTALTDADREAITTTHEAATGPVKADPAHVDWVAFTDAHYTQDAVLMPPNSAPIAGRDAIIAYMSTWPQLTKFDVEDVEMEGSREVTYIKYRYDIGMQVNDSTAFNETGNGIELWKQLDDGTWRCFLDIWSTDMPAAQ